MESMLSHYKSAPMVYLSHLIGHEGPGSIYYELKEKGWALTLASGNESSNSDFDLFSIELELTEEGFEHYNEVVTLIFQYIAMLKREGPQEWIFKEMKVVSDFTFRCLPNKKPFNWTLKMAESMQLFPPEDLITGNYLYQIYDEQLITKCLNLLNPQGMMMIVMAKEYSELMNLETEKWYGTQYTIAKLDTKRLTVRLILTAPSYPTELDRPRRGDTRGADTA